MSRASTGISPTQSRLTLASTTAHNLKAIAGVKFNGAVQTDGNKWLLTGLLV